MTRTALIALAGLLAAGAPALARPAAPLDARAPASPVQVNVVVGAQLKAKARRYGETEFGYLNTDLANSVRRAAAKGGFTRLDLVLEDALEATRRLEGAGPSPGFPSLRDDPAVAWPSPPRSWWGR